MSNDVEPDTEKVPYWPYGKAFIPEWPTREDLEKAIARDREAELKHKNDGAIGPQICTKCKFKNDYAGREHLSPDGSYTCRGCK